MPGFVVSILIMATKITNCTTIRKIAKDMLDLRNNSTVNITAGNSVTKKVATGGQGEDLTAYILLLPIWKT